LVVLQQACGRKTALLRGRASRAIGLRSRPRTGHRIRGPFCQVPARQSGSERLGLPAGQAWGHEEDRLRRVGKP
jgi:hypothetical protein